MPTFFRHRRLPVTLVCLLLALGAAFYRVQLAVRDQLPAYVRSHLAQRLGREVRFGAIRLALFGAFTIEGLELPPIEGETAAPLRATRARVHIAWPELLLSRRVRVARVELIEPRVDVALDLRKSQDRTPVNAQLLALAGTGLETVDVTRGQVRLVAQLPGQEPRTLTAHGFSGRLGLRARRFVYTASAEQWSHAGLEATGLRVAGEGDARETRITRAQTTWAGGSLKASGSYREADQELSARLAVQDFPLDDAARRMGIPRDWRLVGRVTGELQLAADRGQVRSIRGTLAANAGELKAAGMSHDFHWDTARAALDWSERGLQLREVRIEGEGIQLQGEAALAGRPETWTSTATYQARGALEVVGQAAVRKMAALLAYRSPLGGGWSAGGARFEFAASGPVGRLAEAAASGAIAIADLTVQPEGAEAPLHVARLAGRFERSRHTARFSELEIAAPGIEGSGSLRVLEESASAPVRFEADGKIEVRDGAALRRILPRAAMWRWIGDGSPGSGEFSFRASGPLRQMAAVQAEGRFALRSLQLAVPQGSGSGAPVTVLPTLLTVKSATGRFAHARDNLTLSGVEVTTPEMTLRGGLTVEAAHSPDPVVTLAGEVSGERWETLPGIPDRVSRQLRGGHYTARVALHGKASELAVAPVSGDFTLAGARLVWPEAAAPEHDRERKVEAITARYVREGETLRLSDARLRGDGIEAAGNLFIQALSERDPLVNVQGEVRLERWQRLPGVPPALAKAVRGGRIVAHGNMSGRVSDLDRQPASGEFRLEEGTLAWDSGEGRPFTRPIDAATGRFRTTTKGAQLTDLFLKAGTLQLAGELGIQGDSLEDPLVSLALRGALGQWQSLPGMPPGLADHVRGGRLTGSLALRSRLSQVSAAPVNGEFRISDFGLRIPGSDSAESDQSRIQNSKSKIEVPVRVLAAHFGRDGETVELSGITLDGEGIQGSGRVRLADVSSPTGRLETELRLRADDWERLAAGLSSGPLQLQGGRLTLSLRGSGRRDALARGDWSGDVRLEGARYLSDGEGKPPVAVKSGATTFAHENDRWSFADIVVDTSLFHLVAAGELRDAPDDAPRDGRLSFAGRVTSGDAAAAMNCLAPLTALRGGTLAADFQVAGSLAAPDAIRTTGHLAVRSATIQPEATGGEVPPVPLARVDTDFEHRGARLVLPNLSADLPLYTLTGVGTIDGLGDAAGPRLDAKVRITSESWQQLLGMSGWSALAGGRLTLESQLAGEWRALDMSRGTFTLQDARLVLPESEESFPVTRLAGRFERGEEVVRLLDMHLASPIGSAQGNGEIHGVGETATHRFEATWETDQPLALLKPFAALPGALKGGQLSGSITFRGSAAEPAERVDGRFRLAGAQYVPPGTPEVPISIRELTGTVLQEGGKTVLSDLNLASPILAAGGTMEFLPESVEAGGMVVRTRLEVANLGQLLDHWPLLRDRVSGGRMTADLTLRGDVKEWAQTTGSGVLEATGGEFLMAEADKKFQRTDFSPLRATIAWDEDGIRIDSLTLRGSKINIDCDGTVTHSGSLAVNGKAWLTRAFGQTMAPRGFIGFMGRLLGVVPKEIDSAFELRGDLSRPVLTMGITRSGIWRFARRQIPREIQRMATGRVPLWDLAMLDDRRRFLVPPAAAALRDPGAAGDGEDGPD